MLDSVDEISGAKRKQNLTEHAEAARISKQLATAKRDIPLELDLAEFVAAEPDRSRLRDVFRQFELREPLRRLEEALGSADAAAPAPAAEQALTARRSRRPRRACASCPHTEVAVAVSAPETPEGALFAATASVALRRLRRRRHAVLAGECASPEALVDALGAPAGDRPRRQVARRACPQVLAHDTEVAAYLLEPARRAYPFRELCEERGLGRRSSTTRPPPTRCSSHALAGWQREEIRGRGLTDLFERGRAAARAGAAQHGDRGAQARHRAAAGDLRRGSRPRPTRSSARSSSSPARSSRSARPSSSRRSCSASSASRASAAARPATRPTRACCRRSAHEHRGDPQDRALAGADQAGPDLPRRAARSCIAADGRLHTTFNQTAATTGRLSSNNPNLQNIPIRTELGREIRACFVAEPGNLLVSADYSQVELRLLAHIAGEDVLKEIFRRGEDVHTATACRVFGVTPDQIDPGMRSKAKMINYGIVYGLSAYGMADRLDIPQAEADEFIQRYLAGLPGGRALHRGDDRAGDRARLRLDAVRPPPPGPRAARPPLGAAQAGRALRRQHGDPGDRRGHHEGGDGPLRPGARARPGCRRG